MAAQLRRKPFKIRDASGKFKGVVVSNLSELRSKACQKLEIKSDDDIKVFLHEDGTEVDDDEYFQFLPPQCKLVISGNADPFAEAESMKDLSQFERSESQILRATDVTDAGCILEPRLRAKIITNPTFFVSLSDEDLEKVSSLEPERAMKELNKSREEILVYQESCEAEMQRRSELRDATELLAFYKSAVSKNQAT